MIYCSANIYIVRNVTSERRGGVKVEGDQKKEKDRKRIER
jgi:hypothetical protein